MEYPRKGIWSVGLVTGKGLKKVIDREEKEFLSIFISSTPTPLTGYVIIVPKDEVIDLDMPIEEAFRFIVSAGVIAPGTPASGMMAGGVISPGIEGIKE